MTRIPIDEPNEFTDSHESDAAPQPGPGDIPPDSARQDDSNELLKLRSERDQLFERLARATAEYKNSQRRLETEFEQRVQYANSSLIRAILPPIDNFERALAQDVSKVDAASILKGMQIVHDQMMAVLKSQKVEEIAPKPGDVFNPSQHEAVMQQPSDKYTEPTVTMLLEKGYTLAGRPLRPAKVAVSRVS